MPWTEKEAPQGGQHVALQAHHCLERATGETGVAPNRTCRARRRPVGHQGFGRRAYLFGGGLARHWAPMPPVLDEEDDDEGVLDSAQRLRMRPCYHHKAPPDRMAPTWVLCENVHPTL